MRVYGRLSALLICTIFAGADFAQDLEPETAQPNTQSFATVTPITDSLGLWGKYVPRVGFRYDTGDSIGRRQGLSSFQGFLPLLENEDATALTFTDSRLLLDSEGANIGANIGIGHRVFLRDWNRTIGGYLYYDNRDTGASTFNQVSGGIESLGDIWDFRSNFYVPTGDDRNLIGETFYGSAVYFQNNFLILGGGSETWETSLSGVDAEAGARLWSIRGVDFRAFGGGYHFQGTGVPQAWGLKARIEAVIADNIALSLAVQNDRVFDTTVNAGFAFYFPRRSARRFQGDRQIDVIDRLAEPVERIQNIVVDRTTTALPEEFAIDPNTGAALYFLHVADGGSSDGSFEDPYATLAEAFADPRAQSGGVIVYDRRSGDELGPLLVPKNTKVLSAGPEQFVQTQLGLTKLPFSGSGEIPQILGLLSLVSDTYLSGFRISQSTVDNALQILGSNVVVDRSTVFHSGTGTAVYMDASNVLFRDVTVDHVGNGSVLFIDEGSGVIDLHGASFFSNGGLGASIVNGDADIVIGQLSILNGSSTGLLIANHTGSLTVEQGAIQIANGSFGLLATGGSPDVRLLNTSINVSSGFSAIAMDVNGGSLLVAGGGGVVATNLGVVQPAVDIQANSEPFLLDIDAIDADGVLNVGLVLQDQGLGSRATIGTLTVRHGAGGAVIVDSLGVTSFGLLDINVDDGDGLVALNAGTVIANNPLNVVNAANGAALLLEDTEVDLAFQSITSAACLEGAINLDGVTGQILVSGNTFIDTPCGPAISIVDSNVNLQLGTNPGTTITIFNRMDEGVFISGTSGTLAFANTLIDNADSSLATPITVVDSDADISFAGVNIADAAGDAIELDTNAGSFTINDGSITAAGTSAVFATDVNNLTLRGLEIVGTSDNAIEISGINNYTIEDNFIVDAFVDAIHIEGAQGTGIIRNNDILTVLVAFDDSVDLQIVNDANTTIEGNSITSVLSVSNGVNVNVVGGNTITHIHNNEVRSLLSALATPISFSASSMGTTELDVRGNVINSTAGVFVNAGISVSLTTPTADVTIAENTLTNSNLIGVLGDGIAVNLVGVQDADITISNNTITDATVAEGFDDAIVVSVTGGGSSIFELDANVVAQSGFVAEDGIEFLASDAGTVVQATIENNILNGSTGPGASGLNMLSTLNANIAANINGNSTDTSIDLTNFVATFGVVDLPNLDTNNNNAVVNTAGTINNLP